MSVMPGDRSSLRMGGEVPVPTTTFTPKEDGKPATVLSSYGYRNIGTNMDVQCSRVEGTQSARQYRITLTIDENSIYPDELAPTTSKTTGAPAFRSFKSTNTFSLRDGQSVEYAAATDRLSGEVYRVTVKLTLVK
jgi:type II secretory pathway component GspD/PulD (secretin)